MSKKSRRPGRAGGRDRPRTRAFKAPAVLPPGVHPHYDSTFVPIVIPKHVLDDEKTAGMREALEVGVLVQWELGRKGTHIASRWVSGDGNEDTLTSSDPQDDDYLSLVIAHTQRLCMYMGPSGETDSDDSDMDETLQEEYTPARV